MHFRFGFIPIGFDRHLQKEPTKAQYIHCCGGMFILFSKEIKADERIVKVPMQSSNKVVPKKHQIMFVLLLSPILNECIYTFMSKMSLGSVKCV